MRIETPGLKGPFRIVADDRSVLSEQPDFDCAIAYAQGRLDYETGRNVVEHKIEVFFDRRIGHRADAFSAIHRGTAEFFVEKEHIPDAASVLTHCLKKSLHRSFVVILCLDNAHYAFDRNNGRANEVYNVQRFGKD